MSWLLKLYGSNVSIDDRAVEKKLIIADRDNPRINDTEWDRVQELLNGDHPLSTFRHKHDSGAPRKTQLNLGPGMGSQDRGNSAGGMNAAGDEMERNDPRTPRSWYNEGDAQADDETGPGNKSIMPAPDGSRNDGYAAQRIFLDNVDAFSPFIDRDNSPQSVVQKKHLNSILTSRPVPPKRVFVDRK
jgi:hypothetical protein